MSKVLGFVSVLLDCSPYGQRERTVTAGGSATLDPYLNNIKSESRCQAGCLAGRGFRRLCEVLCYFVLPENLFCKLIPSAFPVAD
jgi:hypothetical protein